MAIVRKRRKTSRRLSYYLSRAWYARRAKVQARAQGWCEYCRVRPMQYCHHRSYARFGKEPLQDLMAVCGPCHQAIHGRLPTGKHLACAAHSLRVKGDSGRGHSALWLAYLGSVSHRRSLC